MWNFEKVLFPAIRDNSVTVSPIFLYKMNVALAMMDTMSRRTPPLDDVPTYIRIQPHDRYPAKVTVWLAISECGISVPSSHPQEVSVDANMYHNECIKRETCSLR